MRVSHHEGACRDWTPLDFVNRPAGTADDIAIANASRPAFLGKRILRTTTAAFAH